MSSTAVMGTRADRPPYHRGRLPPAISAPQPRDPPWHVARSRQPIALRTTGGASLLLRLPPLLLLLDRAGPQQLRRHGVDVVGPAELGPGKFPLYPPPGLQLEHRWRRPLGG